MAKSLISSLLSSINTPKEREELSDESKELLSSLPKAEIWRHPYLFRYQGFWYPPNYLQGVTACHQHYRARETDILLATMPKSGTIWLKGFIFAIVNRSCYPDLAQNPLLTTNPHDLVPFLEHILYTDSQVLDATDLPYPRLLSTHIPYTLLQESVVKSNCRIVYLCRNPRDTFISLWHFMNKMRPKYVVPRLPLEEAFEMFCTGVSPFGPFWDHVLDYWKESLKRPDRILFLKYEDIKENTASHLKMLAEFLGYPFSLEEEREGMVEEISKLCSFENLSNLEVNKTGKVEWVPSNKLFFRKGQVGDWMNYLTPSMIERLDQITEQKFQGSGLTFRFS